MAKTRWYAKLVAVLTVLLATSGLTLLSWSLAYAAPTTWSAPINISNSGTQKHPPSITVDFKGNIHVVWFEDDVTPNIVYTKWDGASWSTPTVVNQGTMGGHSLVADSLGRVHLIYIDPSSSLLYYRVLNTSGAGSWSTPTPVSTQIPAEIQWPALAVDSSNNPHVVWPHHIGGGNSTIYYSRWNNQEWSNPQPISNDAFAYLPRIAVDHTGIAHVVWEDSDSHLTYYWDNSNGSAPIQLSSTFAFEPDIATDNAGNVYVVWSNTGLYYRYLQGSSWSPVSTIVGAGNSPSLTVDSAGNLQLAFSNTNNGARYIEHTTGILTQNGISWSVPTFVQSGTNLIWPAIATSTIGQFIQIHIVGVDASLGGGNIDIFYSTAVDEQSTPTFELLAPVDNGIQLTVTHGYNDPPYKTSRPELCNIATPRDHCANQQFGLDLVPGPGWDKRILAPTPGTPRAFVAGAGGPCLLFELDNDTNLNICHFKTKRTNLLGVHVERGRVLGTASTAWVHLSLDARPTLCMGGWRLPRGKYFCPIPFTSPYMLEGRSLLPNGEPDQWNGETFISHNTARSK